MTSPMQNAAADPHAGRAAANGRSRGDLQSPDLVALLDGLEDRLATQPVIEQSKGILIGHFGIDSDTAFDVLRCWSSHTNLKVREISRLLVTTVTTNPPGHPGRAASQQPGSVDVRFGAGQLLYHS